jgi:tetratricopeptide (TPR) repeat protein
MERLEEALASFDKAVECDASIDIGWSRIADVLFRLERYSESADSYRRLLELVHDDSDKWFRFGEALRKGGRESDAIFAFDRAISLDPRSAAAWANRGLALAAHGGPQDDETMVQALYSMDQAIALTRDDPKIRFAKAMMLVFYKREHEAYACFNQAHTLGHPSAAIAMDELRRQESAP